MFLLGFLAVVMIISVILQLLIIWEAFRKEVLLLTVLMYIVWVNCKNCEMYATMSSL